MNPYRALAFSEASFVRPASRETVGLSLELRGHLDLDAMRRAHSAVLSEYPVLAARVVEIDGRPWFAAGDIESVAATGFIAEQGRWEGYAQTPPAALGPDQLSVLALTSDGDRHRFTLWTSHAVGDANSVTAIAHRLFDLYRGYVSGADPRVVVAQDFPLAPDALMAARGFTAGEIEYDQRLGETAWCGAVGSAPVDPSVPDFDDVLRVRFDADTSRAVAARADALGVSLNGLLSALIARAELAELPDGAALALLTPVDFRLRLSPPIPLRSVTALVGFSFVSTAEAGPEQTITGIARVVGDRIRSDVRDGTVVRSSVSPMPDPTTRRSGPPVLISNVGDFPELPTPPDLDIVDAHAQTVRSARGMAEYAAAYPGDGAPPSPLGTTYLLSVYRDRISIEMRTLPTTLDPRIRQRIYDRLVRSVADITTGVPA
jgi:hypothetical protein